MWGKFIIASLFAFGIYQTFRSPKQHCVCGVKIPEGGGMCECGEYNSRMIIHKEIREQELRRIEEEKRKGND